MKKEYPIKINGDRNRLKTQGDLIKNRFKESQISLVCDTHLCNSASASISEATMLQAEANVLERKIWYQGIVKN